ncbi:MAG: putative membrane protein [Granulosicoccus sp.]|jgi:uncharacterized membrane protein
MSETWVVIAILAIATFGIRLGGILLGQRLPTTGPWARALNALPGCLIISLVSVLILSGGINEWVAGSVSLLVALTTRNLPLTMVAGILVIFGLRQL